MRSEQYTLLHGDYPENRPSDHHRSGSSRDHSYHVQHRKFSIIHFSHRQVRQEDSDNYLHSSLRELVNLPRYAVSASRRRLQSCQVAGFTDLRVNILRSVHLRGHPPGA